MLNWEKFSVEIYVELVKFSPSLNYKEFNIERIKAIKEVFLVNTKKTSSWKFMKQILKISKTYEFYSMIEYSGSRNTLFETISKNFTFLE